MKSLLILSLLANAVLGTLYYREHKETIALEAYRTEAQKLLTRADKSVGDAIDVVKKAGDLLDAKSK